MQKNVHFERPVQAVRAVQDATGINRSTILQALGKGAFGEAAYKSGDTWLLDTGHPDFKNWLEAHWQQARVKGQRKRARGEQDTRAHPSGAWKMEEASAFRPPVIWFPDCKDCRRGRIPPPFSSGYVNGEAARPCLSCYRRYFQWFKQRKLIRYAVSCPNYPIRTRIDTTKSLTRSKGRSFYQEVDYAEQEREVVRVEAFALEPCGAVSEHLWIDGTYCKCFPTLPTAQVWIAEQMGRSLRSFWLT